MTDKYRFDDAYKNVYVYSETEQAYVRIGSYLHFRLTARMREETKIAKVEQKLAKELYNN